MAAAKRARELWHIYTALCIAVTGIALLLVVNVSGRAVSASEQRLQGCIQMEGIGCMFNGSLTPPDSNFYDLNRLLDCSFLEFNSGVQSTRIIRLKIVGYWYSQFYVLYGAASNAFVLFRAEQVNAFCALAS